MAFLTDTAAMVLEQIDYFNYEPLGYEESMREIWRTAWENGFDFVSVLNAANRLDNERHEFADVGGEG